MSLHWLDNADSWICPVCGFETGSPAKYGGCKCPKCGFQDDKDKSESEDREVLEQEPCETQMIDKSNFSQEQYKADLQGAYDCGKASVKPCEDAISRAELLQRSVISVPFHMSDGSVDYADMVFAADICRAKPVQPKQKTGWWIDKNVRGEKLPYCSVCGNGCCISLCVLP